MDDIEDKLSNGIALCQMTINELLEIEKRVNNCVRDNVTFIIETKHRPLAIGPNIITRQDKIDVSVPAMKAIICKAIDYEKGLINKHIDKMIDHRMADRHRDEEY